MSTATIIYTVGPPGAGKTYCRCARYLLEEWLPHQDYQHISNFPIRVGPWRDSQGRDRLGMAAVCKARGLPEGCCDKLETFPDEEVQQWRNQVLVKQTGKGAVGNVIAGPWDYLADRDLSGAHIAIDEIHNFCGRNAPKTVQARWEQWLGEIRHSGATVEFLTQHPSKVAACIPNHATKRIRIERNDDRLDPWCGIPYYDWGQLAAKLAGQFCAKSWETEEIQQLGKWKIQTDTPFRFVPEYFQVYDSHSAPITGGQAGTERLMEWQRLSWPRLLAWFAVKNDTRLIFKGGRWLLFPVLLCGAPWIAPLMGKFPQWFAGRFSTRNKTTLSTAHDPGTEKRNQLITPREDGATISSTVAPGARQAESVVHVVAPDYSAEDWAVAALRPEGITFRNGGQWAIGETIDEGPYATRTVQSVDFQRRQATVTGLVLRLGAVPRLPTTPARSAADADIRGPLQPVASAADDTGSGDRR